MLKKQTGIFLVLLILIILSIITLYNNNTPPNQSINNEHETSLTQNNTQSQKPSNMQAIKWANGEELHIEISEQLVSPINKPLKEIPQIFHDITNLISYITTHFNNYHTYNYCLKQPISTSNFSSKYPGAIYMLKNSSTVFELVVVPENRLNDYLNNLSSKIQKESQNYSTLTCKSTLNQSTLHPNIMQVDCTLKVKRQGLNSYYTYSETLCIVKSKDNLLIINPILHAEGNINTCRTFFGK